MALATHTSTCSTTQQSDSNPPARTCPRCKWVFTRTDTCTERKWSCVAEVSGQGTLVHKCVVYKKTSEKRNLSHKHIKACTSTHQDTGRNAAVAAGDSSNHQLHEDDNETTEGSSQNDTFRTSTAPSAEVVDSKPPEEDYDEGG